VTGVIQFDPKDATANGKDVRNIVVQQSGFGPFAVKVNATVWPSHAHIGLAKGDVVTLEGAYTMNKVPQDDGSERTYHNISVTRLKNHGAIDEGTRTDTVNASNSTDDVNDDDIPF